MNNKKIKHTRVRYLILAAMFVLTALILVFLPDKDNSQEMKPEHMLNSLIDNSRFISVDQIAEKLIDKDPSIILIDVRSEEEFEKSSLPGALNIPLDEILSEESLKVFGRKAYDKVLFSNQNILSDQAWILLARTMQEKTFILKGGLENWVDLIINPEKPDVIESDGALELFNFRLAAGRYFAGESKEFEKIDLSKIAKKPVRKATSPKKTTPAPVLPPPVEEEEEEEGC